MKLSFTELRDVLKTYDERDALKVERDALKAEVLALLAGDAELAAKVQAAFEKSEAVEARMRAFIGSRQV